MSGTSGRSHRSAQNQNAQHPRTDGGRVGILAASEPRAASRTAAPSSPQHDEAELERRIKIFLAQRNVPGLRRLIVEVEHHSVILRGRVRTYYEKQLAVHCCQRVAGVINVVDEIDVGSSD